MVDQDFLPLSDSITVHILQRLCAQFFLPRHVQGISHSHVAGLNKGLVIYTFTAHETQTLN